MQVKAWILKGVKANPNLENITVTGGVLDVEGSFALAMEVCATDTSGEGWPVFEPVELFPNPATGTLTLRFLAQRATPLRVEMFDSRGRLVQVLQMKGRTAGEELRLSLEGLEPGLYLIRLHTAGQSRVEKVVVLP